MNELTPSEEDWFRENTKEIWNSILPSFDSTDRHISRMMFDESKKFPFSYFASDSVLVDAYGVYGFDTEGLITYVHEYQKLHFYPIGMTAVGSLCQLEGALNKYDEKEHVLLLGSYFLPQMDNRVIESQGIVADKQWPYEQKEEVLSIRICGQPATLYTRGLATGARMAYKETFTLREMADLKDGDEFDIHDFSRIPMRDKGGSPELYTPNYLKLSPSIILGVEARDGSHVVYTTEE